VVGGTYLPDSTVSHIKNSNVMVTGLSSYFVLNDKTLYCIIYLLHKLYISFSFLHAIVGATVMAD